ncbi:MAG: flotillin-like protein FloA [Firmicutes bacterium]|nr:flotillin-like protein FloA [Bacillota bacterium]
MENWMWGLVVMGVIALILLIVLWFLPISLWFRAWISGSHIKMSRLVGMKLRKIRVKMIVDAYITARKAGLDITVGDIETHYMAGGNVINVVNALISAHAANITLSTSTARAIDLAGRDVLNAVKVSVNPSIIETPRISSVARDGIELIVKVRITVRANISRLVGGAGEDTIIARVGEGIVSTIGSSKSHKEVLENPDTISKIVLQKGLDSGTAYEILSIDIADIDVGRNIGAQLQMDQAEADKRIAQAKAEERRAMAIAAEQEMRAKVQEMQARVVEAEALVPKSLAEALKSGRLGVMDYYNMQNIQADTAMRGAISGSGSKPKK